MHKLIQKPNRTFWLFLLMQAIANASEHAIFISVALYTYRLTGSALSTAGQMITAMLPLILLAHWGGQAADRYDAQKVMLYSNLLRCTVVLLYPLTEQVWQIYVLNLIRVVGTVFFGPAQTAFLRAIVQRDRLVHANGVLSIANGIISLVFPGLVGILIAQFGASVGFWFTSACYGVIVLCILGLPAHMRETSHRRSQAPHAPPLVEDAVLKLPQPNQQAVWMFIRHQPGLLVFLVAYGTLNLGFWASDAAFIPYTEAILGGGAIFGMTLSVYYASTILSGTLVTVWGTSMQLRHVQWLFLIPPLVWFGYSLLNILVVVLVLVFMEGLVRTTAEVYLNSIITAETPPTLVGQVWSVVRGMVSFCTIVGALLGGWTTEQFGILEAFRIVAVIIFTLLVLTIGWNVYGFWYQRYKGVGSCTERRVSD